MAAHEADRGQGPRLPASSATPRLDAGGAAALSYTSVAAGTGAGGRAPAGTIPVQKSFAMTHASEISAARRYGQLLAERAGFGATEAGRLAIAVTEAGTNILKHAGDGVLVLGIVYGALAAQRGAGAMGVQVLALDRGPGIVNVGSSLRDGVSTAGTAGTGLGAMRRLADEFDVYSAPGHGTAIYLLFWAAPLPPASAVGAAQPGGVPRLSVGAVCLPLVGEDVCGDAWGLEADRFGATLVVADGLGHGPGAAAASAAAIAVLHAHAQQSLTGLMQEMHAALRTGRGAAAAVARLDVRADALSFAGVGNISAMVSDGDAQQQLMSHNGIVGHNLRKVQEFTTGWTVGSCSIFCSDGIGTQWTLQLYPGLRACHPALIAGVLYRDFFRVRDDATVVVVKRLC